MSRAASDDTMQDGPNHAAPGDPSFAAAASSAAAGSSSAAAPSPSPSPSIPVSLTPADIELQARVNAYRASCLSILSQYQTHHLIPHSGKVVIFDSQLVVKHAFDAMVHHDLSCAPVWDSWKKKYVGLLSVSDFLDILMSTYANEDKSMFDNLSNARICDWADYKKQRGTSINRLLCISPEATLHEAVRQLLNYRVHRLCVVQLALADTVLRIITNHGILRFLRNNAPQALTQSITIRALGIGVYANLLTLTYHTPVIKALELLSAYKVSSIPIVDAQMRPVDVYTRADVRYLALDQTWTNLDMTIEEALSKHRRGRALGICSRDDSIHTVSGLLVSSMRHSLICVKPDGTIEGVVSLTDIFSFLLNSNAPAAESRIAALMKDYAQFESAEAQRMAAEAAAAAAGGTAAGAGGAGAGSAASDAASLMSSPKGTLQAEEALKQKLFLSEHGQSSLADSEDILMSDGGTAAALPQVVEEVAAVQGVSQQTLQQAIAAGTASALPHPERLQANLTVGGFRGYAQQQKQQQTTLNSPAIKPSQPNDGVPSSVDFLG